MADSAYEIFDTIIKCVIVSISLFGIVGNSMNIIVLRKHGFHESINIVLVSLSISDLLFCILLPVTRLKCFIRYIDQVLAATVNTFTTITFFMPKYVFLGTSFLCVAIIAVERFTAVFFPFRVSSIFNKRTISLFSVAAYAISIVTISPSFFVLNYQLVFDPQRNITVAIVTYTDYYHSNHKFLDFYVWVGLTNIFCSISMVTVLACCVAIIVKLYQASVRRQAMTSKTTGYDVRVVKMLVTVCVIYLCVQIPIIIMYSYFRPDFMFHSMSYQLFYDICDILCVINASVNFIVYVTMSTKFKSTYKTIFKLPCFDTKQ